MCFNPLIELDYLAVHVQVLVEVGKNHELYYLGYLVQNYMQSLKCVVALFTKQITCTINIHCNRRLFTVFTKL